MGEQIISTVHVQEIAERFIVTYNDITLQGLFDQVLVNFENVKNLGSIPLEKDFTRNTSSQDKLQKFLLLTVKQLEEEFLLSYAIYDSGGMIEQGDLFQARSIALDLPGYEMLLRCKKAHSYSASLTLKGNQKNKTIFAS